MFRYFFLFILFCNFFITKDISKEALLTKIQEIYNEKNENNSSAKLTCLLSQKEINEINLDINSPIFAYLNALLELNINENLSKQSQDLLMQEVRNKDRLALLLALQLYFLRKCERCEKVRDISNFDYYRFNNYNAEKLLYTEGGNYKNSFALYGEAFLCKGLDSIKDSKQDSKNAQYFLKSYANFMLAGLHTRAINTLMTGLLHTNDSTLYATFKFLASNDIVIKKNLENVYVLNIMALDSKNYFKNINSLANFKHLYVLESSVFSNYIIQGLMIRDMNMGRVLSPFDRLANNESVCEYFEKERHYENEIKKINSDILRKSSEKEIYEYYRILLLKQKLKTQTNYEYARKYDKKL